jgi:hypothetical protein
LNLANSAELFERLYETQSTPDCGKVAIALPSIPSPVWDRLAEDLCEVLRKSGFAVAKSTSSNDNFIAEIVIGSAKAVTSFPPIYVVYDDNWHFSVSTQKQLVSDSIPTVNVVLSLLTASVIALVVFRKRFGSELGLEEVAEVSDNGIFEFLNSSQKIPTALDLRNETISWFGCGSIAFAVCFALRGLTLRNCHFDFVDNDTVKPKNIIKYLGITDKELGQSKAQVLSKKFGELGSTNSYFKDSLNDYCRDKNYRITLAIIATDTSISRRDLQAKLPKVIINSWTGVRQSLLQSGVSRHEMNKGTACLICEYWEDVEGHPDLPSLAGKTGTDPVSLSQLIRENQPVGELGGANKMAGTKFVESYKTMCDTLNVKTGDLHREFGVPFISAITGAFLALAIICEGNSFLCCGTLSKNLLRFVSAPASLQFFVDPTSQRKDCICNDKDYLEQYKKKWS